MDLYDQLQYTNDELVLCEKKRQSWWNRNKLWIGLGVGIIVGGGSVLLIKCYNIYKYKKKEVIK